jgi:hypothetical protein
LKVSDNRAFPLKYSKNMVISASQNMFRSIFQVIYHKIYTYFAEDLPHFGGILCIFGEFLGSFRGFLGKNFYGIFD